MTASRVIAYLITIMKLHSILQMRWRTLIREADLPEGEVRVRRVLGRLVGVVNVDGRIYVFDGRCPHAGRSLQGAEVGSRGVLVCPGHSLRYSLIPQSCSVSAMLAQLTFRVRDGVIEVDRKALRQGRTSSAAVPDYRVNPASSGRRG